MKVCWFGIYDSSYSRNKILIDGLRAQGVDVIECNLSGGTATKYFKLVQQLRSLHNEYDFLFCAFPVHICPVLAWLFQKKPIVVDAFTSKFDSVVHDRKQVRRLSLKALYYYILDRLMLLVGDVLITDTEEHRQFFSRWIDPKKITVIPVGTHTDEFFPIDSDPIAQKELLVQFHGGYIPLQGVDRIVDAISLLQHESNLSFRLIGSGQDFSKIKQKIIDLKLSIELIPWLSITKLNEKLNEADIILGIFGDTPKTDRVIPNKLFQGLAVRKPVITKDTPAIRRCFSEQELVLTTNEPAAIASAIRKLAVDATLRTRLAAAGYQKIQTQYNEIVIGKKLLEVLQSFK